MVNGITKLFQIIYYELNKLFFLKHLGSSLRPKLLSIFLLDPTKSFSLKKIEEETKVKRSSLLQEIKRLEKIDLILIEKTSQKKRKILSKKKKYKSIFLEKKYKINPKFSLLKELRQLILKGEEFPNKELLKKIKNLGEVKLAVLSGIFTNSPMAIGANGQSKIDLLLVGKIDKKKLLNFVENLQKDLKKEIKYSLMDVKEFKYRREFNDLFLRTIFEENHYLVINKLGNL